ncbi:MAG: hypothetical protein AAF587_37590 [Bacteroidota bacterium]
MALAYLKLIQILDNQCQFEADIGTNSFFQYKIGKGKRISRGMIMADDLVHTSPLQPAPRNGWGPIRTSFMLNIPTHVFRDKARYIQLFSFKDNKGRAVAISSIQVVPPLTASLPRRAGSFAYVPTTKTNMNQIPVKNKAFSYREPQLSESMFWGALVSALPGILKVAGPVLGKLVGGLFGGGGGGGKGGGGSVDMTKMIEMISNLIGQAKAQPSTGQSLALMNPPTAIQVETLLALLPFLNKIISPSTILIIGDDPIKLLKAIGDAVGKMSEEELRQLHLEHAVNPDKPISMSLMDHGDYSYAKIFPALLAALPSALPALGPALGPMAGGLLGPGAIGSMGPLGSLGGMPGMMPGMMPGGIGGGGQKDPIKMMKAVNDMFTTIDQGTLRHLERNTPELSNPNLAPMLLAKSLAQQGKSSLSYTYDPRLDLEFLEVQTVPIQGKQRVLYRQDSNMKLPVRVSSSAPNAPDQAIPKAILKVCIQDPEDMRILYEKKYRVEEVELDSTLEQIDLPSEDLADLPIGRDLKVEVALIWRSKKSKKNLGTFKSHYITLVGAYLFDRIEEAIAPSIPLNDVVKYRAFWHKIWEGGYTDSKRWKIDFDLKYMYALNLEEEVPSKMETRKKKIKDNADGESRTPGRRKVRAKLKSGMELTLESLNRLLPHLSHPILDEEKIDALETTALHAYFNQVARLHVEFKGKSGDTTTLWAFPELTLHNVKLQHMQEVNDYGQVVMTRAVSIVFPRPSSIHFVGTQSE